MQPLRRIRCRKEKIEKTAKTARAFRKGKGQPAYTDAAHCTALFEFAQHIPYTSLRRPTCKMKRRTKKKRQSRPKRPHALRFPNEQASKGLNSMLRGCPEQGFF
eukprot:936443-Pelagomonas_calceolata.AAC.4